jgi:DNA-directed RNA polymerase sigma subunit (sigma70/sigma32)
LEQLKDLKMLKGMPLSMDSSVYSTSREEIEFTDSNAGGECDVVIQDLENDFLRDEIISALDSLKPRESLVIKYRYGLSGEPMSRSEVAEKLGMSFEGIRQCENRAMDKLRAPKVTRSLVAHLDEAVVPSSEKPAEKPKKTKTRRSKKAPSPTSAIDLVRSIQL